MTTASCDALTAQSRALWIVSVGLAATLCWLGLIGVGLAMIGAFDPLVCVLVAAPFAGITSIAVHRAAPPHTQRDVWAPAAVVVALLSLAWNLGNLSEHVLIDRDPGSYAATAEWLTNEGGLRAHISSDLLADGDGLHIETPANYAVTSTTIEFQFNHSPAAVFALGASFDGGRGLFAVPAVVGAISLLAFYVTVRPLLRHGFAAIAAMATIAVSLPFLYVARDTFSELFVLTTLWAGLACLWRLDDARERSVWCYVLAGFLIGSTALFRVDAGLYLIAAVAFWALLRLGGHGRANVAAMAVAAMVPAAIGLFDARVFAGFYFDHLSDQIYKLLAVFAVGTAAVVAFDGARGFSTRLAARLALGLGSRAARVAGGVASVLFVAVWLVRPHLFTGRGDWKLDSSMGSLVGGVQALQGDEVQPWRSYSEVALTQFGWYLGVGLMAFAAAGVGVLTVRGTSRPVGRWGFLLAAVIIGAPLYLWEPNITPDHLWSTRRFMPFVIPALAACAAIGLDSIAALVQRVAPARHWSPRAVVGVGATCMIAPAIVSTWPIRDMADHRGFYDAMQDMCESVGPDSTIVTIDLDALATPLRAWCGAQVSSATLTSARAAIEHISARDVSCAPVHVVSRPASEADDYADLLLPLDTVTATGTTTVQFAVGRPPDTYRADVLDVQISLVRLGPSCEEPA